MKILWFANTPCAAIDFFGGKTTSGGWLYSLSKELSNHGDIELHIAFKWSKDIESFEYNGIFYHPIFQRGNSKITRILYNILNRFNNKQETNNLIKYFDIVQKVNPDVIHIHGTENDFGLITEKVSCPVLVSIQGLLSSYQHKLFAGYQKNTIAKYEPILHKLLFLGINCFEKDFKKKAEREIRIIRANKNIIGRTQWDFDCTQAINPQRKYYYCSEILRDAFYKHHWVADSKSSNRTILVTTISSGIYKGLETIYNTAKILTNNGFDFEWRIIGTQTSDKMVKTTEKMLNIDHDTINIKFHGKKEADEMIGIMKSANVFVQVSHIENSPNSLCEAMLIGIPIIATMAGGTSSILKDCKEGTLIQDGDPYSLAGAIMTCIANYDKAIAMGKQARETSHKRHDPIIITNDLINIYKSVKQNG